MNALPPLVALILAVLAIQSPARDVRAARAVVSSVIRGRIVTDTGLPIRKARVALKVEGEDEGWPVFTDPDGRFQFSSVPPGRYVVTASKAGYVTTRFGTRQPLEPPVALTVAAGEVVDNVVIPLAKGAAITGHIMNEGGDPVVEAAVSAERLVRSGGGLKTVTIKSTTTDDLGEFRLPDLPAGSYLVATDPNGSTSSVMAVGITQGGGMIVGRRGPQAPRMYYPSAISPVQAQALAVQSGEELTMIDMTIRAMPIPNLSIVVADPGATASVIRYELAPDGRSDDVQAITRGVLRVGEPEVVPSFPGDWNLLVAAGPAGAAYAHFTLGEADMTLQVALKPPVKLSGRLLVDGRPRSGAVRLAVEAAPRGFPERFAPVFSQAAPVNPDGTFTVEAVRGPVQIRLRNAPAGWTLQSIALGARRLPDTWVDLNSSDSVADVTLRVTTQPTDLSGTISDLSGQPVARDSIIVFPKNAALLDDPARWARWIKPDANGYFAIRDLPEGNFDVVALRDVDEAAWETQTYLDTLRPQATPVTLTPGRVTAVSLVVKGPR